MSTPRPEAPDSGSARERDRDAVLIRAAGPGELEAIGRLAARVWQAHYPGIISQAQIDYMLGWMYDAERMRAELERGHHYDQLFLRGELAGFAGYASGPGDGDIQLHKLYVHPDHQGRGHGSRLLCHVEAQALQAGRSRLVLTVNKANHRAIAVYQRNGFDILESVVTPIGGGFVMDDYVMAKFVGEGVP